MAEKKISPIHPGETLFEEFLKPMEISKRQLSESINVTENLIGDIIKGKISITATIALRLGRYFGMSPQFWLGLQNHYDLAIAEDEFEGQIEQEVVPYAA
ncbi:HigA family addiction module antitoxin [Desulfobacterales bacterium HSG17]|nr:HigA family addiction module antitoxin [Desulfobacterales bacterium HSG17]